MVNYLQEDELDKFHIENEDGTFSEDVLLPKLLVHDLTTSIDYIEKNYGIKSPLNAVLLCAFDIFFNFLTKMRLLETVVRYLEIIDDQDKVEK